MILIYIALIVAGLYVIFILGPALVAFKMVFCRKSGTSFEERNLKGTYLEPYEKRIREDFRFFRELQSERITICAMDGIELVGDYYNSGHRKLAICMHGYNATPLNCFASIGKCLINAGYDVLLTQERAHGESGGRRSTLGMLEQYDVVAWTNWADTVSAVDEVVLIGVSMGCASVAYASDKISSPKVRAMILDCGFSSPYDQITFDCRTRHLPAKLLMPIIAGCAKRFLKIDITRPVGNSLEKTKIPALFMHGSNDATVPSHVSEVNFSRCVSRKELYIVDGADHAVAFIAGGKAAEDKVLTFLATQ